MADTTFSIDLALQGKADSAEAAAHIQKLSASVKESTANLTKLREAYKGLRIAGLKESDEAKKLKERIDQTRKSIGLNTLETLKMRGGLGLTSTATKKLTGDTKASSSALRGFADGAKLGGGPVGMLASKASFLASVLKGGLVLAAAAGVAALIALDAYILKLTANVLKFAITTADAYRSQRLSLEGMTKAWYSMWGRALPAGNAGEIQQAIDNVSTRVTIGRDKVDEYARSLYKSHLRGTNLTQALLGVSMAASAAGEEYGDTAKALVVGNALIGRSVEKTVNLFKARFGPIVKQQLLSLDVQSRKLKENWSALFRHLNIDPLLSGLQKVLSIFEQDNVVFSAWKQIFTTMFDPLLAGAPKAGEAVKNFAQGLTIMALDAQYQWIQLGKSFSLKSLGFDSVGDALSSAVGLASDFAVALLQGAKAALVLVDALRTIGAIASVGKNLVKFTVGGFTPGGLKKQDEAITGLAAAGRKLLGPDKTMESGFNMIDGIISGIEQRTPALQAAARSAANAANKSFQDTQGIHSKSKVWTKFGSWMTEGAVSGLKQGTPRFASAAQDLANIPQAQPSAVGKPNLQTSKNVSFGDVHVHGQGGQQQVTIPLWEFKQMLANCLEGEAIHKGATT